jgi:protein-tyrosine-phosphatase
MAEVNIDLSEATPTYVVLDELKQRHFVITMGCTIPEFTPASYGVELRVWTLETPERQDIEAVRPIRDEIELRVESLFDEIETNAEKRPTDRSLSGQVMS